MAAIILKLRTSIILLISSSSLAYGALHAPIKIATPSDLSGMPTVKSFIRKSYENLGYQVVFKDRPSERSLSYVQKGFFDADLVRSKLVEMGDKIIHVDVPLAQRKVYLITLKGKQVPHSLSEIDKQDRGVTLNTCPVSEKLAAGLKSGLFKVSQLSEIEYWITSGKADFALTADKLPDPQRKLSQKIVHYENMYHVVSGSLKDLIPSLEAEFKKNLTKEMKDQLQKEISP